ncbi:MAG TPA: tRNA pseudouridine(38-40) synthase TruA [Bacillota bacterium]|jgi:tRNA pseudouridine38-40 synthase|nr:tRNA pseudouridine(38-40) synthase TruA [Bacillota bacterium]
MRRIGLVLEYVGTRYRGFQVQAGEVGEAIHEAVDSLGDEGAPPDQSAATARAGQTVQGTVEAAIARITREQCRITGAGRTDAGVHALGQVASFDTDSRIPGDRFAPALNTALPPDVRVLRSFEAPAGFNARYDAIAKVYRYVIVPRRIIGAGEPGQEPEPPVWPGLDMQLGPGAQLGSAVLAGRALLVRHRLDVQAMSQASRCLVGRHDFRAFASTGSSAKTSVRTIRRLEVEAARSEFLGTGLDVATVEIEADGFLYKMVRTIVGALLEVGAGRADAGSVERLLASGDRSKGPATAPPDGLYLVRVIYPEPVATLASGAM